MSSPAEPIVCTPKRLPDHKMVEAAVRAIHINPVNRPALVRFASVTRKVRPTREDIAFVTTKWWGADGVSLTVGFLDNPPADLQKRILLHMNAWSREANIQFRPSNTDPQVRIARSEGQGYWSYLGTDIETVPADEPTMNLEAFTMETPDSEFYRVVRHETGHTLGCPHEHMRAELVARIDPRKAIRYFGATQGWSRQDVIQQVLTPLDDADFLLATVNPEQDSIMCYQLPGSIMKDGKPILGGTDITDDDYALAALVYPLPRAI